MTDRNEPSEYDCGAPYNEKGGNVTANCARGNDAGSGKLNGLTT